MSSNALIGADLEQGGTVNPTDAMLALRNAPEQQGVRDNDAFASTPCIMLYYAGKTEWVVVIPCLLCLLVPDTKLIIESNKD